MSNKPPKKTDLDKQWMNGRYKRTRNAGMEYHLIVCEGTKTEPNYFAGMKKQISLKNPRNSDKVELQNPSIVVEGTGKSTADLLDYAQKRVAQSDNVPSHVWLVFDKDDFSIEDFNSTIESCASLSCEEIKYHALWSNECIELWYLLHFSYLKSNIHRVDYQTKLSKYLTSKGSGAYKKNRSDMFSILFPKLETAIKNAKKLKEFHEEQEHFSPSDNAPGTNVFEIFEKFRNYL